jgi:hypothetical protein
VTSAPGSSLRALQELVAGELAAPATPAAAALADAIVARHGAAVAAVVFYGSCLRKKTHEGVLDFYVLVDSYRAAYGPGWLAFSNALLPPNVFYLEGQAALAPAAPASTVRCKYAVVSTRDFERLVGRECLHPYVWARFAQPARLVWSRDASAREAVERCAARAICTLIDRLSPLLPARGDVQRFSIAALWKEAFRRTYRTEFRSESADYPRTLYEADPARYARATHLALDVLRDEGRIRSFAAFHGAAEVHRPARRRSLGRIRWQLTWPVAKATALLRLLKTATTFGDWLPYALWKLERHSGARPELTERQRRHPLIFGWPVILRLLSQRALR